MTTDLLVAVSSKSIVAAVARKQGDRGVELSLELVNGDRVHCRCDTIAAARQLADRLGLVLLRDVTHYAKK